MSHLCFFIIILVTLQSLFIGKTEADDVWVYEIYVESVTFAHDHTGLIVVPGRTFGHVKALIAPTINEKDDTIKKILAKRGIALVKGDGPEGYLVVLRHLAKTFENMAASRYVYSVIDGFDKKETKDASPKIPLSVDNYGHDNFGIAASKITQKTLEFTIDSIFGTLPFTFGNFEPGKFSMEEWKGTGEADLSNKKLSELANKYLGTEFTPKFTVAKETGGKIMQKRPVLSSVKWKITGFSITSAKNIKDGLKHTVGFTYAPVASAA